MSPSLFVVVFYLSPLPNVPFTFLSFLELFHGFLSLKFSSIRPSASHPPSLTFACKAWGFCLNDVFLYFNHISRPRFSLSPLDLLHKWRLPASSQASPAPGALSTLSCFAPHQSLYCHPLLPIRPLDLAAHTCLCLFHRLTHLSRCVCIHELRSHMLCTL